MGRSLLAAVGAAEALGFTSVDVAGIFGEGFRLEDVGGTGGPGRAVCLNFEGGVLDDDGGEVF